MASCGKGWHKKAGISAGGGTLSQRRGAVMGKPVARAGSLLLGRNLEKGGSQNANETKGAAGFPSRALPMVSV